MPTIAEYLSELSKQRNQLAENLNAMGVQATDTEKLNTLVSKVLQIPSGGKTILYDSHNQENIHLSYNDTVYSLADFTAIHTDFCNSDNDYALNYDSSVFGWDSQIWTCCTRPISATPATQIAIRFLSGSTETGTMRLVQSDSSNPTDILTSATTDGKYIDLSIQWIYSTDYVTTLTPCENVNSDTYYLVWVGRSNNSHPLIKSITIFP